MISTLGYVDLKDDGPLVIEVPPGFQGIIDDFRQRPSAQSKRSMARRGQKGQAGRYGMSSRIKEQTAGRKIPDRGIMLRPS
jgi:hypothetical protein